MILAREIKPIRCADVFGNPDAHKLLAEYAAECSIPSIGDINPQPEMYTAMEHVGLLKCLGAYQWGVLVGFANVLTSVLPHYGRKVATIESLFVAKASRPDGIGKELMQAVEQYAKSAGCTSILYSAPAGGKLERLLYLKSMRKKGYSHTNSVFCRSL